MDPKTRARLAEAVMASVPYWSQPCKLCGGHISDPLLECTAPQGPAGSTLHAMKPGAALLCPYCHEAIGFNNQGFLDVALKGWPVVKYSKAALEAKKQADGAPAGMSLEEWAKNYRFDRPGFKEPLKDYPYAP